MLAESRCLLEGHLPYNIPMERLNTSVESESPAWNLEDPTECLAEIQLSEGSNSGRKSIQTFPYSTYGTNGIFAYKFTIHLSQMYR